MKHTFILLSLLTALNAAARVESVYFQVEEEIPTFKPPSNVETQYALFQGSLPYLTEGLVIWTVLNFGNDTTGVSVEQQNKLSKDFAEVYKSIAEDPDLKDVQHSLVYSYRTKPHTQGHYYIYIPDEINEHTDYKIFLHGFGGNFLYYIWLFKEEYPDSIIILPTYSYTWWHGTESYFREVLIDVKERFDLKTDKPWLFGLSAGGPAGFKIYSKFPDFFKGYVCISSGPFHLNPNSVNPDLDVFMINGIHDNRMPINEVRKIVSNFRRKIKKLDFFEIDGDHFFMLTQRRDCFDAINNYIKSVEARPNKR